MVSVLFYMVLSCVIVFGLAVYIMACIITIFIVNCKKTWQRILLCIISMLITPVLFLIIWLIVNLLFKKDKC